MIINNEYSGVKSSEQVHKFGMTTSSVMFKVLSDSLYSNKIGSIVRELASNARDAHIVAGKKDVPFEIEICDNSSTGKLFGNTTSVFRIRDFGTGLSESEIYDLYAVYGVSNKRDTNELAGGFGIGSKSPFAYTESFMITSYYNGSKMLFSAFIGQDGCPSISLLHKQKTNDPNGLEITIPINNGSDISKFRTEVECQLAYFDPRPVVAGGNDWKTEIKTIDIGSKKYTIYERMPYILDSGLFNAKIGGIIYPIMLERVGFSSIPAAYTKICLNMNIGDIDLSASRESIAYSEKTISVIFAKVCEYISYQSDFLLKYAKKHSEYESARMRRKLPEFSLILHRSKDISKTIEKTMLVDDMVPLTKDVNLSPEMHLFAYTLYVGKFRTIDLYASNTIQLGTHDIYICRNVNASKNDILRKTHVLYNKLVIKTKDDAKINEFLKVYGNPVVHELEIEKSSVTTEKSSGVIFYAQSLQDGYCSKRCETPEHVAHIIRNENTYFFPMYDRRYIFDLVKIYPEKYTVEFGYVYRIAKYMMSARGNISVYHMSHTNIKRICERFEIEYSFDKYKNRICKQFENFITEQDIDISFVNTCIDLDEIVYNSYDLFSVLGNIYKYQLDEMAKKNILFDAVKKYIESESKYTYTVKNTVKEYRRLCNNIESNKDLIRYIESNPVIKLINCNSDYTKDAIIDCVNKYLLAKGDM